MSKHRRRFPLSVSMHPVNTMQECTGALAQDSQKSTILEPTSSNIDSKTLPRQLQDPLEEAPTPKKTPKVIECWSFLHFSYFSKDRPEDVEKLPRWHPKWPKLAHLGANLIRTLPILALSLPILAPRCDPRPLEMEPQT